MFLVVTRSFAHRQPRTLSSADISDKDLPRSFLEGIYKSILENEIRTLGEGADGFMTLERWKDVMRSASHLQTATSKDRCNGLSELLLESCWQPILSAIYGLWNLVDYYHDNEGSFDLIRSSRYQDARLGIDLAYEVLSAASNFGRSDIFQEVFANIVS